MSHTTANAPASPASPPTTGGAGTSPSGQVTTNKAVNSQWTITLFGTAVGAGILFLPISAGSFGFIPLLVATLLIFPMTYLAHRAFSWIISYSPLHGEDVLAVLTHFFGRGNGIILAIIYWFTIFPVVLIYGVSITNTVDSFIVNQLGGPSLDRWLLAMLCVGVMTGAFAIGRKPMIWLAQVLVYPLIIALAVTSIYLIPRWDLQSFLHFDDGSDGYGGIFKGIFLILPVLVFSFSHMAALSQFALDMQPQYGEKTEKRVSRTEFYTSILLVVFTMFFVWSCVLALGADGMNEALEQNIPVLSYFANVTGTPFMAYMAPIVVICAIVSSYFGHMLGTEEGTEYLLKNAAPKLAEKVSHRTLLNIIYVIAFVCTTLVAIFNPSIISMISVVSGVFVAFIVYLVPVYMFKKLDVYKQFRNDPWNYFVFGMGLLIMAVTIWDMI